MSTPAYTEKFIAFIDILGFKSMVEASQDDQARLDGLLALMSKLGSGSERATFEQYGPICCPEAPLLARDLDYCVTQISDCVIISAEVSPAGLINLIDHCWKVTIRLLEEGIQCRGFVTRGLIYHTQNPSQVVGPGYQVAYGSERTVNAFKRRADEEGTPYIELDDAVVQYAAEHPDKMVKEMFHRFTKFDGYKVAIFPFKRLTHEFAFGGIYGSLDAEKELQSIDNVRGWIVQMKTSIQNNIAGAGEKVIDRSNHYIDALDQQLVELAETEKMLRLLDEPAVRISLADCRAGKHSSS